MNGRLTFPAVAAGVLLAAGLGFAAYHYCTNYIPFNSAVWRASQKGDQSRRKPMVHDLIERHIHAGMTRAEVEQMLGVAEWRDDAFWAYNMGPGSEFISLDDVWLAVEFKNDRVVRAYRFRD